MSQSHWLAITLLAFVISVPASADTLVFSGALDDSGNTALVGSGLGTALFDNPFDISNNVALYTFSVVNPGTVNLLSKGFGLGGADPYFTLFQGTGGTATFLGSNYVQAFSTGGDFNLDFSLSAGDYTVAMGVWANMSFAENLGVGTLADGFIGLGEPMSLGNSQYELDVTRPDAAVPEPASAWLLSLVMPALLVRRRWVKACS